MQPVGSGPLCSLRPQWFQAVGEARQRRWNHRGRRGRRGALRRRSRVMPPSQLVAKHKRRSIPPVGGLCAPCALCGSKPLARPVNGDAPQRAQGAQRRAPTAFARDAAIAVICTTKNRDRFQLSGPGPCAPCALCGSKPLAKPVNGDGTTGAQGAQRPASTALARDAAIAVCCTTTSTDRCHLPGPGPCAPRALCGSKPLARLVNGDAPPGSRRRKRQRANHV